MKPQHLLTGAAMAVLLSTVADAQTLPAPPVSPAQVVNYEYDAQGNPTRTIQAPGVAGFNFATTNTYDFGILRATCVLAWGGHADDIRGSQTDHRSSCRRHRSGHRRSDAR